MNASTLAHYKTVRTGIQAARYKVSEDAWNSFWDRVCKSTGTGSSSSGCSSQIVLTDCLAACSDGPEPSAADLHLHSSRTHHLGVANMFLDMCTSRGLPKDPGSAEALGEEWKNNFLDRCNTVKSDNDRITEGFRFKGPITWTTVAPLYFTESLVPDSRLTFELMKKVEQSIDDELIALTADEGLSEEDKDAAHKLLREEETLLTEGFNVATKLTEVLDA